MRFPLRFKDLPNTAAWQHWLCIVRLYLARLAFL